MFRQNWSKANQLRFGGLITSIIQPTSSSSETGSGILVSGEKGEASCDLKCSDCGCRTFILNCDGSEEHHDVMKKFIGMCLEPEEDFEALENTASSSGNVETGKSGDPDTGKPEAPESGKPKEPKTGGNENENRSKVPCSCDDCDYKEQNEDVEDVDDYLSVSDDESENEVSTEHHPEPLYNDEFIEEDDVAKTKRRNARALKKMEDRQKQLKNRGSVRFAEDYHRQQDSERRYGENFEHEFDRRPSVPGMRGYFSMNFSGSRVQDSDERHRGERSQVSGNRYGDSSNDYSGRGSRRQGNEGSADASRNYSEDHRSSDRGAGRYGSYRREDAEGSGSLDGGFGGNDRETIQRSRYSEERRRQGEESQDSGQRWNYYGNERRENDYDHRRQESGRNVDYRSPDREEHLGDSHQRRYGNFSLNPNGQESHVHRFGNRQEVGRNAFGDHRGHDRGESFRGDRRRESRRGEDSELSQRRCQSVRYSDAPNRYPETRHDQDRRGSFGRDGRSDRPSRHDFGAQRHEDQHEDGGFGRHHQDTGRYGSHGNGNPERRWPPGYESFLRPHRRSFEGTLVDHRDIRRGPTDPEQDGQRGHDGHSSGSSANRHNEVQPVGHAGISEFEKYRRLRWLLSSTINDVDKFEEICILLLNKDTSYFYSADYQITYDFTGIETGLAKRCPNWLDRIPVILDHVQLVACEQDNSIPNTLNRVTNCVRAQLNYLAFEMSKK